MSPKRLTRKEIVQKNAIERTLTAISNWGFNNLTLLAFGLLGLLLLVGGFYGWRYYSETRDSHVQQAFGDALLKLHAPVVESVQEEALEPDLENPYRYSTPQERSQAAYEAFSEIAAEHSGHRLGAIARYYTGIIALDDGRSEEARKILLEVIESARSEQVRNLARSALAQIYSGEANYAEANELLEAIAASDAAAFPQQLILGRLAANYEAMGDLPAALEMYRRILDEFPTSNLAQEALTKISELERYVEPDAPESEASLF